VAGGPAELFHGGTAWHSRCRTGAHLALGAAQARLPGFPALDFGDYRRTGEIAYFAQSSVLYERILGRVTPALPRFSATLIEPAIGDLLRQHNQTLEQVFAENPASLAQLLAARSIPAAGKQNLAAAELALKRRVDPAARLDAFAR